MCNVIPNRRMAFTLCLSVLVAGCGIKWATNRVLSNPDAIAKVGAVYDVLTPRDTAEKLVFIPGDSVIIELTDSAYLNKTDTLRSTDTIRITNTRIIRRTDTIKWQLRPDNRAMARLLDSLGKYTNELNQAKGSISARNEVIKRADNILLLMGGIILVLGIVIGLLLRFKVKL